MYGEIIFYCFSIDLMIQCFNCLYVVKREDMIVAVEIYILQENFLRKTWNEKLPT